MKYRRSSGVLVALSALFLMPASHPEAMHISEGILPLPWAIGWLVAAAPFVA